MIFGVIYAAIWHPVINNTIPQGVRVRWNITSHAMEYTHSLIKSRHNEIVVKERLIEETSYSVDDFLKHYHRVGNQMFLSASKTELQQYFKFSEFTENLAYNSSDLSTGIVMANSEVIDVVVDTLESKSSQLIFHSITQNNHFAQTKIHERYPYLLSHLKSLRFNRHLIRLLSSFVRGHKTIAQEFINRIGIKWILEQREQHPDLVHNLNCLGYDVGSSLENTVLISMFNCD